MLDHFGDQGIDDRVETVRRERQQSHTQNDFVEIGQIQLFHNRTHKAANHLTAFIDDAFSVQDRNSQFGQGCQTFHPGRGQVGRTGGYRQHPNSGPDRSRRIQDLTLHGCVVAQRRTA